MGGGGYSDSAFGTMVAGGGASNTMEGVLICACDNNHLRVAAVAMRTSGPTAKKPCVCAGARWFEKSSHKIAFAVGMHAKGWEAGMTICTLTRYLAGQEVRTRQKGVELGMQV